MRDVRGALSVVRRAVPVAVLCAALAACGTRVSTLYEKVIGSPSYGRVTEEHTRTREVHDGLETRMIVSATWLSGPWVRAFSEEYANIQYLGAARKDEVVAAFRGESDRYVRFFLALFTPDERSNDLEKPETLWTVHLVGPDEKDYSPVYVRKSGLRTEEISRFFPYSGTWYRAYEIAFPKEAGGTGEAAAPGAARMKLVLTGVQGRAVLVWN